MSGQCVQAIVLAWRDWRHEFLLSLCALLALASMLAPLLILQGLKNGVITGMRERLLQDPAAIIITPKSDAGRFTPEFIQALAQMPGASYAIGRIRETASDLTLENREKNVRATIALEPSTPGEPLLQRYDIAAPGDGQTPQLVLSANAAASLKAARGDKLQASLSRRTPGGRLESLPVVFEVAAVLPVQAADRKLAFAPLSLLEDMENYRDNIAVPQRNLSGSEPPGPRQYASFRLYAKSLDDVEALARGLEGKRIEVITRSRDIAAIRRLEGAINRIILIISLAVGAGFVSFTFSSSESSARRKRRMLGMLRLLGFQRLPLVCFPVAQCILTAAGGFAMSLLIYGIVSRAITAAFADRGGIVCQLNWLEVMAALALVILLSAIATIRSAWQAAALEPSLVIRDI